VVWVESGRVWGRLAKSIKILQGKSTRVARVTVTRVSRKPSQHQFKAKTEQHPSTKWRDNVPSPDTFDTLQMAFTEDGKTRTRQIAKFEIKLEITQIINELTNQDHAASREANSSLDVKNIRLAIIYEHRIVEREHEVDA